MKKAYVTPTVEKVEFQYDKVVAASGNTCTKQWINIGDETCGKFEWVKTFEI